MYNLFYRLMDVCFQAFEDEKKILEDYFFFSSVVL